MLKSFIFCPYPILEVKKCVCSQKKELIKDMKFIFFQKKATSIVPILPQFGYRNIFLSIFFFLKTENFMHAQLQIWQVLL